MALVVGVVALAGILVLHDDARYVFDGLTSRALPLVIISAICGVGSILLLRRANHRGARLLAVGAVVSVIWAWGVAQWPYMLPKTPEGLAGGRTRRHAGDGAHRVRDRRGRSSSRRSVCSTSSTRRGWSRSKRRRPHLHDQGSTMASRIEDYAIIGDTQTAALVAQGRVDRLALRPPVRLRRRVRRAARDRGPRSLEARAGRRHQADRAPVPRRHARARDDVPHRRRRRAGHRLHADPRQDRRHRPPRRGRLGAGPDAHGPADALRLRRDPAVGRPTSTAGCTPSPAPTRCASPPRRATEGAGRSTVSDFVVEAGDVVPFMLAWHPSHEHPPPERDAVSAVRSDRDVVAQVVEAVHVRGRVARDGDAVAHHAQGAHVRADRRDRRRRRPRRCPSGSAASATGTTATAGCATRCSRCSRS